MVKLCVAFLGSARAARAGFGPLVGLIQSNKNAKQQSASTPVYFGRQICHQGALAVRRDRAVLGECASRLVKRHRDAFLEALNHHYRTHLAFVRSVGVPSLPKKVFQTTST